MTFDIIDLCVILAAVFVAFVVGVLIGCRLGMLREKIVAQRSIINAQRRVDEAEAAAIRAWMQKADREFPEEL